MTLTYVYLISPPSVSVALVGASGKTYTANAAGVVTGVAASDALLMTGVGDDGRPLLATGTTADRPDPSPSPPIGPGLNNAFPPLALGLPFFDSTLSKTVFFVGTMRSVTGWVDNTGAPA
jgi:hypothetical protein